MHLTLKELERIKISLIYDRICKNEKLIAKIKLMIEEKRKLGGDF